MTDTTTVLPDDQPLAPARIPAWLEQHGRLPYTQTAADKRCSALFDQLEALGPEAMALVRELDDAEG